MVKDEEPLPSHSPSPLPSSGEPEKIHASAAPIHRSIPVRIIDSFRRDPSQHVTAAGKVDELHLDHGHDDNYDVETAILNVAKSPLAT
jgi:hypothetical protein